MRNCNTTPLPSQHVQEYLPVSISTSTIFVISAFHVPNTYVKYGVRSPKFIWAPVYICTPWLKHRNSRLPSHLGSYTRTLLVSLDRQHLFVTPWLNSKAPVDLWALQWVPRWDGKRRTWWPRPGRAWPSTGRRRNRWTRGRSAPGRPTGTKGAPRAVLRTRTRNTVYS